MAERSLIPFGKAQAGGQFSFPLSSFPYYARTVNQELQATGLPKNYTFTGFVPGYPLQASELNEVQERFFLNQTLTTTMMSNWGGLVAPDADVSGPGWGDVTAPGACPVSPTVGVRGSWSSGGSLIEVDPGWFLVTLPDDVGGGLKQWVYFEGDGDFGTYRFEGVSNGSAVGFQISKKYFLANENVEGFEFDPDLADNSSLEGTPPLGAVRVKLVLTPVIFGSSNGGATPVNPDRTRVSAIASPRADQTIRFINNYLVDTA